MVWVCFEETGGDEEEEDEEEEEEEEEEEWDDEADDWVVKTKEKAGVEAPPITSEGLNAFHMAVTKGSTMLPLLLTKFRRLRAELRKYTSRICEW